MIDSTSRPVLAVGGDRPGLDLDPSRNPREEGPDRPSMRREESFLGGRPPLLLDEPPGNLPAE